MRVAKVSDIKVGVTLVDKYGEWFVTSLENGFTDVWVINGKSGSKLLFEKDVKYFDIDAKDDLEVINEFETFSSDTTIDARVCIGAKDVDGNDIKELDVLEFTNNGKKEYLFIEYDKFYCAFKLRSSKTYTSKRDYKSGGKIVGCILDFDLPSLDSEIHNVTSTYDKWSKKNGKEVIKQMRIK